MSEAVIDATLNVEQKRAVTHGDGPLLVVAGAGTGKTTVITRRLAWLIDEENARADEILALTFTEKAAAEMEDRVDRLLPFGHLDLWVSTFHAFGDRILRERGVDIGIDSGFHQLSEMGQWGLIRDHLDEFNLSYYKPLGNPTKFISGTITHISRLKDEAIGPDEYMTFAKKTKVGAKTNEDKTESERVLEMAEAYATYQRILHDEGLLDYGDLINETLRLFRERPNVLRDYQKQFCYILVDEYQDTNIAQNELVKILGGKRKNITVVGDDDQSIYKFRGAALSNILEFKRDYLNAEEVVLTENYRSRQEILDLAYDFIQLNNPNRLEAQLKGNTSAGLSSDVTKKLKSQQKGRAMITYRKHATEDHETNGVLESIIRMKKDDTSLLWSDFAVLIRTNDMATSFINVFTRTEIPYQYVAAKGLFTKPEILDVVAYFKLLDDYHESSAVHRVLTWERSGIPMEDIIAINHYARRKSISLYDAMRHVKVLTVGKRTKLVVDRLLEHIQNHTELARREPVSRIFFAFLEDTNLRKDLAKVESVQDQERLNNLNRFAAKILEFEREHDDTSLKNFMREIELMTTIGEDPRLMDEGDDTDAVRIMTVHKAKGLEFQHVFLPKLVDKRFPSTFRTDTIPVPDKLVKEALTKGDVHLEEERRLFYVAVTRSKASLHLSSAEDYGGMRKKRPSRFLQELNQKIIDAQDTSESAQRPLDLKPAKPTRKKASLKHDPNSLSFSSMNTFWTCPYQYRFAYVLNVPYKPKHVFNYGTSIHGTLRDFYQLVRDGKKPTVATLKDLYGSNWIDEWYESQAHMRKRKEEGWKAMERMYKEHERKFMKPKYLERAFTLKIDDVIVKGKIDRIDEHPDGNWEVIDYKTGEKPKEKRSAKTEQLLIYALAAQDILGKMPEKATFYYVDAGEKIEFKPTLEGFEKINEKIRETAKDIRTSEFKATPGMHCRWCDFRDICEFRSSY